MNARSSKNTLLISSLADFTDKLSEARDFDCFADLTIRFVARLTQCADASLLMFNMQTFQLAFEKHYSTSTLHRVLPRLEITSDIVGSIGKGGEILTVLHGQSNHYLVIYEHNTDDTNPCELRIPFIIRQDYMGVLSLGKKVSGMDYTIEEIDTLRILAKVLSSVTPSGGTAAKVSIIDPQTVMNENNHIKSSRILQAAYRRADAYSEILGDSPAIHRIIKTIDRIAGTDAAVLITGESGTGKELVARAIHKNSLRDEQPLVIMNCASIPETLVESELFGYEKGAFTGAISRKKGKFEFADHGTLFLDEIGDMSLVTQAKLLRVLENGTFQSVGGTEILHADVRLITATNKNLAECIEQSEFREDLFYRINVVQIDIPPLRERREDISILAQFYFDHYNKKYNKSLSQLDNKILSWMLKHFFPGNVRELRNIVERTVIMNNDPKIISTLKNQKDLSPSISDYSDNMTLADLEKKYIQTVLEAEKYNKSSAARRLGIARKTLREKMEKYKLSDRIQENS